MKIDIHCKGMSITDAIRNHVEEKLGKIEKILPGELDVLTILNYESSNRGGLFSAEVSLRAWGTDIVAKNVNEDLYKAVNEVSDSAFAQLRKAKEKRASKRKGGETVRDYVPPAEPLTLEEEEEEVLQEMAMNESM